MPRPDYHGNKHHFREHLIPENNESLDVGLTGWRFGTGRFANLIVDTVTFLVAVVTDLTVTTFTATTATITTLLGVTSATITSADITKLSNLTTDGYVKTSGGDGTLSVQATPIPNTDLGSSGSATTVLHGNETFAAVSLTADVSGVLPVANGGTNANTAAGSRTSLGAAPLDATFVTLSTNSELSDERVLTAGTGITITDAGAGSTVTISVTGGFSNPIATMVFGG